MRRTITMFVGLFFALAVVTGFPSNVLAKTSGEGGGSPLPGFKLSGPAIQGTATAEYVLVDSVVPAVQMSFIGSCQNNVDIIAGPSGPLFIPPIPITSVPYEELTSESFEGFYFIIEPGFTDPCHKDVIISSLQYLKVQTVSKFKKFVSDGVTTYQMEMFLLFVVPYNEMNPVK